MTRWLIERFPAADGVAVVCSLAAGADSMVAEQLLRRGAALRAVIPCAGYEHTFDDHAAKKYNGLLSEAESVVTLPFDRPSEEAFLAAGYRVVDEADLLLAVWDGKPARGLGGTADVVQRARAGGKPVEVVWPAGVER